MSQATALLTTKLGVQARSRRLLARPRLLQLIDGAVEARLVLLSAPAGFGKSALLVNWLASGRQRVAWLSLDAGDNDPARFLRYLREAALELQPLEPAPRSARQAPGALDTELVLADLVSALAARAGPAVVVLDDYHAIDSPAVHATVASLIEHLPGNARLVLTTRADPPLPLARLRARGELLEIRADALRFTRDEAAALLAGPMALDLAPHLVDVLAERTEGWAAALQLAALSLRDREDVPRLVREFGASNRFLLDFLLEEILGSQPAEVQEFLLRTSVPDRLTGELCDVLTGRSDGAAMLNRLERSNMPLFPLDAQGSWYRYHQLLAELLRNRLARRDPELPAALHGRASSWFEERGMAAGAVAHALASGDVSRVCRLVRRYWMEVMHAGELWTVQRWLEALPGQAVRGDPQLCATYAWGYVLRGETPGVGPWLDAARDALAGPGVDPADRALVPSQLEMIEAKLAELCRDPEAEIAHARTAIELIPAGLPPEMDALLRGDATNLLGQACLLAGDDIGAAEAFRAALPLLSRANNAIALAHGARHLAGILIRRGDAREALEVCDSFLPAASEALDEPVAAAALHLARAEALEMLGEAAAARSAAQRAETLARDSGDRAVLQDARAALDRLPGVWPAAEIPGAPGVGSGLAGLVEPLTARELEVLRLVALARSNRQIASALFVTTGTVKAHIHSICAKLGTGNRVQAIVRSRELGLLD